MDLEPEDSDFSWPLPQTDMRSQLPAGEARAPATGGNDPYSSERVGRLENQAEGQGAQPFLPNHPHSTTHSGQVNSPHETISTFFTNSQDDNSHPMRSSPSRGHGSAYYSNYRDNHRGASNRSNAHVGGAARSFDDYQRYFTLDDTQPGSSSASNRFRGQQPLSTARTPRDVVRDPEESGIPIVMDEDGSARVVTPNYESLDTWDNFGQTAVTKRQRKNLESGDELDTPTSLTIRGAVALIAYQGETPNPSANDVWPNFRSAAKLPVRYFFLERNNPGFHADDRRHFNIWNMKDSLTQRSPSLAKRRFHVRTASQDSASSLADSSGDSGWPMRQIPTELFEEIASYLNRDDIKAMRLVCREFDRHISQVLFNTVVVPFNTEIYGMLGQARPDFKGKKKIKVECQSLVWKNANGDDVYNGHGLDVFRGFGKHILRFGMSFDVNEESLSKPPGKSQTEEHTSFWGSYDWPYVEYRRFDDMAGLESAADETPRMKTAFSELHKVRELALSIDSGLGWLNGPDRSIRARILRQPPAVFDTADKSKRLDRRAQAQKELWDHIKICHQQDGSDVKLATLYKFEPHRSLTEVHDVLSFNPRQPSMPHLDRHLIHEAVSLEKIHIAKPTSFNDPSVLNNFVTSPSSPGTGLLFTSSETPSEVAQLMSPVIPANLTKAQKEWLLETEWAQRAFISSYVLSVVDNAVTFQSIHTLRISQLSDRFLHLLHRQDFWDALPRLEDVTIKVIPGWRNVVKDEAGFVDTPKISPSGGIDPFYDLLNNMVRTRKNIQKLTIGWVTGGEHAEGLHARNKLLLPAPVLPANKIFGTDAATTEEALLRLPHVIDLTLVNCWITPPVLTELVKQHDKLKLKNLVLDSVSLTAIFRTGGNNQQANHIQVAAAAAAPHAIQVAQVQPGVQNNINPQHILQFHIQALQTQIQNLQAQGVGQHHLTALQVQLQNQLQLNLHFQNNNQHLPQNPPVPNFNMPDPHTSLRLAPRDGSWLSILDIISPGLNLSDFNSTFSRADPNRSTSLESLRFISCGYAKLPHSQFDQNQVESTPGFLRDPFFTRRYNALACAMLSAKWPLLGEIVQEVHRSELHALAAGWDFEIGWRDPDAAMAPTFDGALPGGTGRFSGVVGVRERGASAV